MGRPSKPKNPDERPTSERLRTFYLGADPRTFSAWERELIAEVRALREELKTTGHAFEIGGLWMNARTAVDLLTEENELRKAENAKLREELADAEKRAEYAWKDGFGSAEAGESGNVDALVKAATAVIAEDCGLYAADALAAALKPFEEE